LPFTLYRCIIPVLSLDFKPKTPTPHTLIFTGLLPNAGGIIKLEKEQILLAQEQAGHRM